MIPRITIDHAGAGWQRIHADWWQDDQGNDIHRVVVDDEEIYHCHRAGSCLPWDGEAESLDEAMGALATQAPGAARNGQAMRRKAKVMA